MAFVALVAALGGMLYWLGASEPEIHVEIPARDLAPPLAPTANVTAPKVTSKKLESEVVKVPIAETTSATKL